jgi:hypothetical protein
MTELKRYGFFTQSHEDDLGFMAKTPNGEFMFVSEHMRLCLELNAIIEMQNHMLSEAMQIFQGKSVVSHELKTSIEAALEEDYNKANEVYNEWKNQ